MPRKGHKSVRQRLEEAGHLTKPGVGSITFGSVETSPPEAICDDAEAVATWNRVCRVLCAAGRFQVSDRHTIERLAVAQSTAVRAGKLLLEGGWTQKTQSGYDAVTSCFTVFDKSSRQATALERSLGVSVLSRASLQGAEAGEGADELQSFLAEYE